ncbi:MAG: hypothetical protein QOG20_3297 [Pseudonocardiales bacterium]|nr:hypothetical protein [Pseudonocardiales bacterium]
MNDTTSTPDDDDRGDQDGRSAVATGEQAAVTADAGSAGTTAARGDAGTSVAANATAKDTGSGRNEETGNGPASVPRPSPRPDAPGSGEGEPVVEEQAEVPVARAGSTPASGSDATTSERAAGSAATASEAPTATMRVPAPAGPSSTTSGTGTSPAGQSTNGARPSPGPAGAGASVPGADDVTRSVGRGELPTTSPAPAPGPIPGPGPAAAAPPPWQRVPGREQPQRIPVPAQSRPAGGLLDDEGPTTFLESPSRSDDAGATQDGTPGERSSGWAGVRAVRNRPPRQAALQLKRLDPWSVLKLALVLAVVLFFIWLVAVGVLYGVLDGMGVWDRLNGTYADLVSGEAPTGSPLISAGRVFGLAAVVGAINSLLFAVAITVGAFVYNVSADLVGGIEVTLSERD